MIITLTPFEVFLAITRAIEMIQMIEMFNPENYKNPIKALTGIERRFIGTVGEIAVAKAFGTTINPLVFAKERKDITLRNRGHDVGDIEVRATTYHNGKLIVGRTDFITSPYVLAILTENNDVRLAGWLYGYEAKKPEFWNAGGRKADCWYISQDNLKPIQSLIELKKGKI